MLIAMTQFLTYNQPLRLYFASSLNGYNPGIVVAFLASEEADFITGHAYNVNGGLLFH